jgi:hypothetical protein
MQTEAAAVPDATPKSSQRHAAGTGWLRGHMREYGLLLSLIAMAP